MVQLSAKYNYAPGDHILFCDGFNRDYNEIVRVQFEPRSEVTIVETDKDQASVNYSKNAHVVIKEEMKTLILPKENGTIDLKEDIPGSLPRTIFYGLDQFDVQAVQLEDSDQRLDFTVRQGSCRLSRSFIISGVGHDIDFGYYFAKR